MNYIFRQKDLLILFASTFLFFTSEALFLPTLPVYLSSVGYSNFRIGCVLGAFALGVLLFRPLSGYVTDEKSRKLSLVIGVTIFFVAPLFYLVSTSFAYLIAVRFFHGLGITFYTTAMPAFITDIAAPEKRGETLGHMATSTTLAFAFGPLAGILVFERFGFSALVMTCVFVGFLNLMTILMIREHALRKQGMNRIRYREIILRRSILVSSFIQLINAMIFGGIMSFLPVLLNDLGMNVGMFFIVQSITIIICRMVFARFSDRYGRGPVFFCSFVILLASVFMVSMIDSVQVLLLTAVLFGTGSALCSPTLSAFMADETRPENRGAVFGFFFGAFDAGVLMAGLVLGFVADLTTLSDMFATLALIGAVCLLVFSLLIRKGIMASIRWTFMGSRV